MIRRVTVLCLVLSVLFGLSRQAEAAQEDAFYGQPVVSVSFSLEGGSEVPANIAALSEVRVGQPLRRTDVSTTIRRLDSLSRFDDIAIDALSVPGGVAITWRLVPRHPITRLEVRGAGIDAGGLESAVRQRFGGIPTTERLSVVESAAEAHLRELGYLDAEVTAATEVLHNPDRATLVLTVESGPLGVIRSTTVRSDAPLSEAEIIRRTETRVGQPFRRRAIEAALGAVEDELRSRGYYEAQAVLPVPARAPDGLDVVITINTGPRVEVRVVPADALPGSVDQLIPLRRLGSADEDLLEDSQAQIERLLHARGYWRATARFSREVDEAAGRLIITFTITRGPRFYVERVDLPPTLSLPAETLRKLINVAPGDVFDQSSFERGLAAVIDTYRRNGYYQAKAVPAYEEVGVIEGATRASVILHPRITEGPQGRVAGISFALGQNPPVAESALRAAMTSRTGGPFVDFDAARDQSVLERVYQDLGFRRARVDIRPDFSENGREVTLNVVADPGTQIRIGEIAIVGNQGISESAIRDELQLRVGDPAGVSAIDAAIGRLNELGVFRRVTITSLDQFSEAETQLVVNVVEAPKTTIAPGGGVEGGRFSRRVAGGARDDLLEFAPSAFFEATRRSIGGRNRTASLFARVTLKREREEDDDDDGFGFTEYRVSGTFRERNVLRTRTDLLFGVTSEQAVRTSYNFIRQSGVLELYRPITRQVSVSGSYNLEFTKLFDTKFCEEVDVLECEEAAIIDRAFPQVRLSYLTLTGSWDRRDQPLAPTRGTNVSARLEGAFRKIGSQVGYLKGFFEAAGYRRLFGSTRTVGAVRAQLGLASGFAREGVIEGPDGPVIAIVDDLPASKRFFAGGGTTVRGFQIDRLAVSELITPRDGLPRGGNGLVVLNAELRRQVTQLFGRNLGGAVFIDGGNVFSRANEIDLSKLRAAAGFGVRYDTPLGTVRLDFGFKVKPVVLREGLPRERGWEYHLSIGEAF